MIKRALILNFPKITPDAPPLAPALLTAICRRNNVDCDFIDVNAEFYINLPKELQQELLNEFPINFTKELTTSAQQLIDNYFCDLKDKCQHYDLVAISVFSHHSVNFTKFFLDNHRHEFAAQVVVGGAGLNNLSWCVNHSSNTQPFYEYLYNAGLTDYWILGEGEESFESLLQGIPDPGVNSRQYNFLEDFEKVPIPNYDHYNLDYYQQLNNGIKLIAVEGSRGCVKNCTFCDIKKIWGSYKFKNGHALANEIIKLLEKYQANHFWFNDSLINGSLKTFRDFISELSLMRQHHNFTWSGQAIVRKKSSQDEQDFITLKRSGCSTLAVGVESFSQRVRFHMTKKFTDDDLDNFLHLAQKYNIKLILLMIVGYPTETQEDFEIALQQLERYQHLADDGTISGIQFGTTNVLIPDTPLDSMKTSLGVVYPIKSNQTDGSLWSVGQNTPVQRIKWRVEIGEHAQKLGYNCIDSSYNVEHTMISFLNKYLATQ